jgi:diguanylate cyclase (GGDEF)-like protein/PAS domain S-box-containing protein
VDDPLTEDVDEVSDHATLAADYAALIEFLYLTPLGIIKFRPDGAIEMANPAAAALLMPLARAGDMANLYDLLARVVPDLGSQVARFQPPAGQICDPVQFAIPGTRIVLTLGLNKVNAETFMAVIQDITRRVEQESRIRADQQRFRAIFDNIRDYAIYTVGRDGHVEAWNRSLSRLGGWEPADTNNASVDIFFPRPQAGPSDGTTLLQRARCRGTAEYDGPSVRRDGSTFWGNTVATALPDRDGEANGFVLITRDVSERKQQEDRLVALAMTDPLTGVSNRRAGEANLQFAYSGWRRYGSSFAVLMIDCDHFKSINDRWGHDAGDAVLIELVRLCRENLRDTDIIVRWGGEEFLMLLFETSLEMALLVAERLRLAIEEATITFGSETIRVTVSIGAAQPHDGDRSSNDVVQRADHATYRAKRAGRNRIAME